MEEETKNKRKTKTPSSEVRKVKKTTKKKSTELNNDELLEQILAKKSKKKNVTKSANVEEKSSTAVVKTKSKTKSTSSSMKKKSTTKKNISSDDLYEQIKAKKTTKKKKEKVSSNVEEIQEVKNEGFVLDKRLTLEEAEEVEKLFDEKIDDKEEVVETIEEIEEVVDTDSSKVIDNEDKTDSMIITRELNFDVDKFDIKNQELLDELKKAIDEFDTLDEQEEKEDKEEQEEKKDYVDSFETEQLFVPRSRSDKYGVFNEDETTDDFVKLISTPREPDKKKSKIKSNRRNIALLFVCFIIAFISIIVIVVLISDDEGKGEVKQDEAPKVEEKVDMSEQLFQECMSRPNDDADRTEKIIAAEEALTEYIKKEYKASIMYEDLTLGFKYSYNTDKVYYAASTIKTLGALYIYEKAAAGEIDLEEKVTYTKKFDWPASAEVGKLDYGTKISLRDLVKYSITVSDNAAHQMLVSYIGRNELKEYGKSLGATKVLTGSDNFGNINTDDAIIYLKKLNDFINSNSELGEELQSYFVAASQNGLELTEYNISAAHKYGQYDPYYHDIGIVYDENLYLVAILTTEYSNKYLTKIQDINSRIYDLHKLYYENREEVCRLEVYDN